MLHHREGHIVSGTLYETIIKCLLLVFLLQDKVTRSEI